jgi:hypothetical protein
MKKAEIFFPALFCIIATVALLTGYIIANVQNDGGTDSGLIMVLYVLLFVPVCLVVLLSAMAVIIKRITESRKKK